VLKINFFLFVFFRVKIEYELVFFFFFQAEDGIRDSSVTGVQTCALPIWYGTWTSQHDATRKAGEWPSFYRLRTRSRNGGSSQRARPIQSSAVGVNCNSTQQRKSPELLPG